MADPKSILEFTAEYGRYLGFIEKQLVRNLTLVVVHGYDTVAAVILCFQKDDIAGNGAND
jgi:hypothetical protein